MVQARAKLHEDESPLEASLGFLLRDVSRALGKVLAARIEPHGVSVPMWYLLRLLSENEGLTQREISKRLRVMEPTALETLRSMEDQGLISRTRDLKDRRKVSVCLSRQGWTVLKRLLPLASEVNALIEKSATAQELRSLRGLLARLRHDLSEDSSSQSS